MTIKEVEERTGLARANIRYYEDQGFFSAARGENGYRNYSDENVDILLRVKLLRQLGFSLEEIHALQKGEQSLDRALAERESGLEAERRALDQSLELCRAMRQEGVDFYTLDARRYLDRLAQERVLEQDRDPVRIFPWRRFFARNLDLSIYAALATVVLQLTARMNFVRSGTLLPSILGLLLMTGAETAMLHFWGTTPGKALLGLKILRGDGSRLSLEEAAQRTILVMVFFGGGLLLGQVPVPLFAFISLGMLIWACWRVYHEKPLFWEEDGQLYLDGSTRARNFWDNNWNWLRVVGSCLAVFAACVGLMVGGHLLVSMPPHRGPEITVEQFVDNYNRYMEFSYGRENLTYQLTANGTFEEIPRDNNAYVVHILGESPVPQPSFRFTEEGGVLTQVTLVRSYDSGGPITGEQTYAVGLPYEEIAVAARCFLWKSLGNDGAAELYQELLEQEGNLRWQRNGFTIDSQARFSGYGGVTRVTLFAEEGRSQSYFVECTMKRAE